jgi:hypothetical protein
MTTEVIEILKPGPEAITPGARWNPEIGAEALRFLSTLPEAQRQRVETEAAQILARSTSPGEDARRAGLVAGYVQSGKTTSFTATAALARDNGYGLVIVIAGTSKNLLQQTRERLKSDLGLADMDAYRRWVHIESPTPDSPDADQIRAAVREWKEGAGDKSGRATVLLTAMKQHTHMDTLALVLEQMHRELDLSNVTALVVDDEADQATPNLKREGEQSATYARLRRIRSTLPSHTLLQYTATPQAPLLVSIADEISPDFTCVLATGDDYTGGQYFFGQHHDDFFRPIPGTDLSVLDDEADDPPQSLLQAFACFCLGAAAAQVGTYPTPSQRSMLVHPSHKTLPQEKFVHWLKASKEHWEKTLELDQEDPDRRDLIEFLQLPYADLARTVEELPPLEALVARLPSMLRKMMIVAVNAAQQKPQPIEWSRAYAWVLVGGTLLDRGFTVEGLTVTYMPRGTGVQNADTIQQRARFFGYKRLYAAFCRAWLDPEVDDAYVAYVEHEEAMREQLLQISAAGKSLKEWKRVFLLDKGLKPTRASVIRLPLSRPNFGDQWFPQLHFESRDDDMLAANRNLVNDFASTLTWRENDGSSARTRIQIHNVANASLSNVLESLLADYVMFDEDAPRFTALRVVLQAAAESPKAGCSVYQMSRGEFRNRGVKDMRVKNLFQGRNPRTGVATYEGDAAMRADGDHTVTVQIHRLNLTQDDGSDEGSAAHVLEHDVPALAIWVPALLAKDVIIEK